MQVAQAIALIGLALLFGVLSWAPLHEVWVGDIESPGFLLLLAALLLGAALICFVAAVVVLRRRRTRERDER